MFFLLGHCNLECLYYLMNTFDTPCSSSEGIFFFFYQLCVLGSGGRTSTIFSITWPIPDHYYSSMLLI